MKKTLINPLGTEGIYQSMQFSQAVRKGHMIFISGQVGMDENLKMAVGIEEQARRAFQNVEKVIEEAGACMDDIVELVTYHISMKDMGTFAKVKSEFFKKDYPAWTAVAVNELVMPRLLVEIRATAVVENT